MTQRANRRSPRPFISSVLASPPHHSRSAALAQLRRVSDVYSEMLLCSFTSTLFQNHSDDLLGFQEKGTSKGQNNTIKKRSTEVLI
ncbi:hypothetical protein E2C01_025041 [Portunus trituberculatus]|uniref:Uncharacterized protein n=1 Tax=Portunus trituberculatus TaxID=210409 RepID=A0A5B7EGS6_PORTR|nr:hypothetical protein [Portunus trituberculatus]